MGQIRPGGGGRFASSQYPSPRYQQAGELNTAVTTVAAREVRFGAQTLVKGRDFVRKRGAILLVDLQGTMACLECGHRWRVPVSDEGFYAARAATCPRCGAGTRRRR